MTPRDPQKVGSRYHQNRFYKGRCRRERLSSKGVALHRGVAATIATVALQWATWPLCRASHQRKLVATAAARSQLCALLCADFVLPSPQRGTATLKRLPQKHVALIGYKPLAYSGQTQVADKKTTFGEESGVMVDKPSGLTQATLSTGVPSLD